MDQEKEPDTPTPPPSADPGLPPNFPTYKAAPDAVEGSLPEPPAAASEPAAPSPYRPAQPVPPPPLLPRPAAPPPAAPQTWAQPQWHQGPPQQPPPQWGAPPPPYGPPPPAPWGYPQQPPPPVRRSRALPIIIGIAVLFVIISVGVIGLISATATTSNSASGSMGFNILGDKVAVLEVNGTIGEGVGYGADTATLIKQVQEWSADSRVKGMVIRLNTPGGAVSATQELYDEILKFKTAQPGKPRPVVASMGDLCASGGTYLAMACDTIYANPGTLTGSVGVIMSFMDYQGLQSKVGVFSRSVKSGEFKDIGSGSRAMTEAEKALLDEMIQNVYGQFFDAVVDSRKAAVEKILAADPRNGGKATEDQVREHLAQYCDGRVFSGNQAYVYGFVDTLASLEKAIAYTQTTSGVGVGSEVVTGPIKPRGLFGAIGSLASKVDASPLVNGETAKLEFRYGGW